MAAALKTLHIQYFALMREQRGCSNEVLESKAANALELYDELKVRHGFSIDKASLQVAINDKFAPWDSALKENDKVVFIPPVAGG